MIVFSYWLKSYVKNFLNTLAILLVVLIILNLPGLIDGWSAWFNTVTAIKLVLVPVLFKNLVVIVPLAAAMSHLITLDRFVDSNEWICMRMYGLSGFQYLLQNCCLAGGITILVGILALIVIPEVNAHSLGLVSAAKVKDKHSTLLQGKRSIIVSGNSVKAQEDYQFKGRYIFGDTVYDNQEDFSLQLLLLGSSLKQNNNSLKMNSGVMYLFELPQGGFQKMEFKKMYTSIPSSDGIWLAQAIRKFARTGWVGHVWDKILFTFLLMVGVVSYMPFLLKIGRYKAGFVLVVVYGCYLNALRALEESGRINWSVHLSFLGFMLMCGLLLRFCRLFFNRTGSVL